MATPCGYTLDEPEGNHFGSVGKIYFMQFKCCVCLHLELPYSVELVNIYIAKAPIEYERSNLLHIPSGIICYGTIHADTECR